MLTTNRERLLATLVSSGAMHRAELARVLGVSRTTVTNLIQELESEGVVSAPSGAGLKTKVHIVSSAGVLVSLVFRAHSTMVTLAAADARVLTVERIVHRLDDAGGQRLELALAKVMQLLEGQGRPPVLACHAAVNTQVDVHTGEVLGGKASSQWSGVNPKDFLMAALGAPVVVENTARLLGLVEHLASTGGVSRNLLYVHLGGGVGMGQVLDGRIVQGSHGGAGELGHLSIDPQGAPCSCANRGCLMQYVGKEAVLARASAVLGSDAELETLVSEALAGNQACVRLVESVGEILGEALAGVSNLLNPDVIVLGGRLAQSGEMMAQAVRRVIGQRALPLVVRGLTVTTAQASCHPEMVADAGLHSLVADHKILAEIVRNLIGVSKKC